jgi:hypothetical protein
MNQHLRPRQLSRRWLAVVIFATLFVTLDSSSSAFASGGLSSIILTKALPDLALSSPGPDNGPINSTNINTLFASDTVAQRALLSQQLSDGNINGYVRIWHSQPLTGDGLVLTVFQTSTAYSISTFLGGFEKAAAEQVAELGGSTFGVPGVADAKGFDTYVANNNPPFREFVVAFAKGNAIFIETLATSRNDLTEADAINLAQRQSSKAPGSAVAPEIPVSFAVDLLCGLIAALVVAIAGVV